MIRRLSLVLLVAGCETYVCPEVECPAVPDEPALATHAIALDPGMEDGTLEVLEDEVVLEYTDSEGNTWRVTWPRE